MKDNIFNSESIHVAVVLGPDIFDLTGKKSTLSREPISIACLRTGRASEKRIRFREAS
jgi:hypothetical protein